ncbi:hypothetical protein IAE22_31540, partial [Bacillus sp. S34]|nr:hypothetical protein [Bacillus sp. S34]
STFPVTVRLSVQPSNSALRVVRNDIEVKIQPESSTRTTVPVQSVANGKVNLTMSLASPTGDHTRGTEQLAALVHVTGDGDVAAGAVPLDVQPVVLGPHGPRPWLGGAPDVQAITGR